MKTRNAVLGFFALTIALGGTYASTLVPVPGYIKVRLIDTSLQCTYVRNCESLGNFTCRAHLTDPNVANPGTRSLKGLHLVDCFQVVLDFSDHTPIKTLSSDVIQIIP